MLLYTRLAAPKAPKRRSRAGCSHCKEKKKKCDETRPKCSRCEEHKEDCVYEPVKPRQRRKNESFSEVSILNANADTRNPLAGYEGIHGKPEMSWDSAQFGHSLVLRGDERQPAPPPVTDVENEIYSPLAWSPQELTSFSVDADSDSAFDFASLNDVAAEDDVEEIIRYDDTKPSTQSVFAYKSMDHMSHVASPSPLLEFYAPAFAEFSKQTNRRGLVDHFCNVLSHLIVLQEDHGNPFQQLVLPLSHNSQAVTGAILALASAHLEFRGVENGEKSVYFHNQAIQGLARLIAQGETVNKNELLAAIMLLVYYEVLVQKGRSNIVSGHLKGAMAIMSNAPIRMDPTSVFLERAFRFYDVIAALSFGTAPQSTAPMTSCVAPYPPSDFHNDIVSSVDGVDSLLGMATSLWPIIHRLSNMKELKDQLDKAVAQGDTSKAEVLRSEFETTASAIETALEDWQPSIPSDSVLSLDSNELSADKMAERGQLQSIVNSALAYRHSAFVYLYSSIYVYPRSHDLLQRHVHASLTHCLATVRNQGPMGALLWPLFVASCDATNIRDRDAARQAFAGIDQRQGMANIERAWVIVQEVWRQADEAEIINFEEEEEETEEGAPMDASSLQRGDLWRRVSGEMGVTIVFG